MQSNEIKFGCLCSYVGKYGCGCGEQTQEFRHFPVSTNTKPNRNLADCWDSWGFYKHLTSCFLCTSQMSYNNVYWIHKPIFSLNTYEYTKQKCIQPENFPLYSRFSKDKQFLQDLRALWIIHPICCISICTSCNVTIVSQTAKVRFQTQETLDTKTPLMEVQTTAAKTVMMQDLRNVSALLHDVTF